MLVQIVGHSHGGNVSIEAANILQKKYGIIVDRLILLGTPNRNDYQLNDGAASSVINVYSNYDQVQINGGSISTLGMASRSREGAENIQVGYVLSDNGDGTFGVNIIGEDGMVSSHTTIHNTEELISYINNYLNEN
ncbi:MAG: hypothetical protein ED557_04100 [Balneola sp.]|nr:MAG: hypothetical protein ED557_04100 [Balneola sp.]